MFLPESDREYLASKAITYELKSLNGTNGLIIKDWVLPLDKYNRETADLLILIPPGYPDVHPDMWYFSPAILLKPNNAYPRQTNAQINFDAREWQRWSRHLSPGEWRSTTDGIHTFLQKVINALVIAT
jgi:hypothetical protein